MEDEPLESLGDDQAEKVAGGYIFNASVLEKDRFRPWEILDSKGNVIERFDDKHYAEMWAPYYGQSTTELTWEQVQKLRETGSPF